MEREIKLETPRLVMYETVVEEAEEMYNLNSDPEVMKYTGEAFFDNIEGARNLIRNYAAYKKYGYGRWTLRLKENNEFLGWCGLKYDEEFEAVDIGYRLLQEHWNKGYATEAAKACIDYGFTTLGLKCIIGVAYIENKASIRVFEKLGIHFEKYGMEDGHQVVFYAIEK